EWTLMNANGLVAAPPKTSTERQTPLPGARTALLLLLAINLFNYIDRSNLFAAESEIRKEFFAPGNPSAQFWLNLSDKPHFWMGLLTTAFMVSYMILAPAFGWLADRFSRWWLIAIGVLLWSIASGASGLAASFGMLLLTRCFVGVGE